MIKPKIAQIFQGAIARWAKEKSEAPKDINILITASESGDNAVFFKGVDFKNFEKVSFRELLGEMDLLGFESLSRKPLLSLISVIQQSSEGSPSLSKCRVIVYRHPKDEKHLIGTSYVEGEVQETLSLNGWLNKIGL